MSKKKWEVNLEEENPKVENTQENPEGVVVENTKENRIPEEHLPRQKREQRAELELVLARLRCRGCNSLGNWKIVKTAELLRYVQCGVCSKTSAIATKGPVTRTLRPGDIRKMQDRLS